jgi:hypothetical protein
MPQLSTSFNAIPAQPGMPFDGELSSRDVVSRAPASVNIPFGVYCELTASGQAQPLQTATTLSGTATLTNGSASVTFSTAQSLNEGQLVFFSDQPGMPYRIAATTNASTSATLDRLYSGTGGAGKLTSVGLGASSPASSTLSGGGPNLLGISVFDPLGTEQNYVTWSVASTASGTCAATNGSTTIAFTQAQTLAQGAQLTFSSQPGVVYFLAQAMSSATIGYLTQAYSGTTNGAATVTFPAGGSTSSGWRAGQMVPFMRRGRIWASGDASGTALQYGTIDVHHSSNGNNPQGVFTFLAPQMTVGNEIDVAPGCIVFNPGLSYNGQYTDNFGNVFSIYPVEISI